jgi:multidrug resistance efflux pump
VSDFETVRHGIWSHSDDDCAEGEIALDRIEAEVERQQRRIDALDATLMQARSDVLRSVAEVERLRSEREEHWVSREIYDALSAQYDRAAAEVERLRKQLDECEQDWKDTARAALAKEVRPTQTDP